jgi:hypothetical protein
MTSGIKGLVYHIALTQSVAESLTAVIEDIHTKPLDSDINNN